MSLQPLLSSTFGTNLEIIRHLLDQSSRREMYPEILGLKIMIPQISDLSPCKMRLFSPSPMDYRGLWDELLHKSERGASTVMKDESNFRVDLDVQHFAPDEISVKIVDSYVIVEAKHEEKEDEYGWISRQFTRRYIIPKQCDIDQVSSKLSSDGVLSIIAPRIPKLDSVSEGIILNIEHTGKPCLHDTEEKSEKPEVKENGD